MAASAWRAAGLAFLLATGAVSEAAANSLSGAYLAGRIAASRHDYAEAAQWFAQALAGDPLNTDLRERTLTLRLLTGDLRGAAAVAGAMAQDNPGHQFAGLALAADALRAGDWDATVDRLRTPGSGVNPLVAQLLIGWAETGRGDAAAMETAFDALGTDGAGAAIGNYSRGLARAALGDAEGARAAFQSLAADGAALDGRPALALAAALEALEQADSARQIYVGMIESGDRAEAQAEAALARLDAGEPARPLVADAREGAAEALLTIAGALGSDRNASLALIYARLAVALRPDLHDGRLLVGALLAQRERYEDAVAVYEEVPRRAPQFLDAEIARADALVEIDRDDDAIAALRSAVETKPDSLRAWLALGSTLRRAERWEESAVAYDAAIALIDPVERRHWPVFYERGIAHERAGQWDLAEADLMRALELEPDQPLVLNYLGYSWVELRRNLEEAQAMIEKAVEQRPEDGYITDSLGWVLYRLGKYEEAAPIMERAVELAPVDPTITDHYGDVLWMVGRKLEARFQWRRALSFEPEEKDAVRIRAKLERGLDAVLREEEAARAAEAADASRSGDGG